MNIIVAGRYYHFPAPKNNASSVIASLANHRDRGRSQIALWLP
jgi:hypothetical protein